MASARATLWRNGCKQTSVWSNKCKRTSLWIHVVGTMKGKRIKVMPVWSNTCKRTSLWIHVAGTMKGKRIKVMPVWSNRCKRTSKWIHVAGTMKSKRIKVVWNLSSDASVLQNLLILGVETLKKLKSAATQGITYELYIPQAERECKPLVQLLIEAIEAISSRESQKKAPGNRQCHPQLEESNDTVYCYFAEVMKFGKELLHHLKSPTGASRSAQLLDMAKLLIQFNGVQFWMYMLTL
jgi:hypothetical protein